MTHLRDPGRRSLLKTSLIAGGLSVGGLLSVDAFAQGKARINMQLGLDPQRQPDRRSGGQAPGLLRAGRHRLRDPARRPEHRWRGDRGLRPLRGGPGLFQSLGDAGGLAGPADQVLRRRRAEASVHLLLAGQEPGAQARRPGRQEGRHSLDRGHPAARPAGQEQDRREGRHRRHRRLGHGAAADRPGRRGHRLAHQHDRAQGARPGPRRPDAVGWRRAALCAAVLRLDQDPRDPAQGHRRLRARDRARLAAREGQPRPGRRPAGQGVPEPQARGRARRGRRHARVRPRRPGADPGLGRHGPRGLAGADLDVCGTGPVHGAHAEGRRRHLARRAQVDRRVRA